MTSVKRYNGRAHNQVRTLKIIQETFGYSAGSVLFQAGNTKVLCSVTLQPTVPPFMKGKKTGWLNAEYAMLPTATKHRTQRATSVQKLQGRSIEISRLIGRVLRTVVDLSNFGERTIIVDCDVLQADGGTRSAAITGACIALKRAEQRWLKNGTIEQSFLKDEVAAVSVGKLQDHYLLDLDFAEDSIVDGDFNFILTKSNSIIEIQGTAEKTALSWDDFNVIKDLAVQGVEQIFTFTEQYETGQKEKYKKNHTPLFSLQNRLKQNS
ncbi:MAG: ribonuclease PH [Candidatus Dependentiae bacterium]